jgi:hypothetical protein
MAGLWTGSLSSASSDVENGIYLQMEGDTVRTSYHDFTAYGTHLCDFSIAASKGVRDRDI